MPDAPRLLVVTGHFPPAQGGVQTVTWEIARRLPPQRLAVIAPEAPDAADFDAQLDFPVIRRSHYLLVRRLRRIVEEWGCRVAWVPAAAPFGLTVPFLRRAGIDRIIVSTHGQELGWLRAAPTRTALRRILRAADAVTYLNEFTKERLRPHVDPAKPFVQLSGAVDLDAFSPGTPGSVRGRARLTQGPTVVSVARLVRRKGHDMLLRSWPRVLEAVPTAQLVIVGDGPMAPTLRQLVAQHPRLAESVTITGGVPQSRLVELLRGADAFVLPCRDDRWGLQSEGLGLSVLEASAVGLPVVVGNSGGSSASVLPEQTGLLVRGEEPNEIARALIRLLANPEQAQRMGARGHAWVLERWSWSRAVEELSALAELGPSADTRGQPTGRGSGVHAVG